MYYKRKNYKSQFRRFTLKIKSTLSIFFGVLGALVYSIFTIAAAAPFLALSFFFAIIPFWEQRIDLAGLIEKLFHR
tara:strand:- start:2608 stop:2835 length:228 start_codon:yes stop_codon:yes gene_type:complete